MSGPKTREPLRVGIAGLGAVGLEVAKRLIAGVPGLKLTAVAVRDAEKARRALPQVGESIPVRKMTELANDCDIVVECLPPALFRDVALSAIDKGRILMPLSVAQLLENGDLIERARQKGARILVPTGALIGLDAVRAAAEGTIHSVKMVTRKPPAGLEGAPYLREKGISVSGLKEPLKVFDGSAREGARGFPANVNVAAALSLAGIGPDRTQLEIWADPNVTRNTHTISVDADTARFTMTIENIPSENPRTGKSVAPSTVAALRATCIRTESGDLTGSDAQEDLVTIQVAGERDGESEPQQMGNKDSHARGDDLVEPGFYVAAHETQSKWFEAGNSVDEIDRNGIGADPHEDSRPHLPSPDINGLVHETEQDRTVTAGDQHK